MTTILKANIQYSASLQPVQLVWLNRLFQSNFKTTAIAGCLLTGLLCTPLALSQDDSLPPFSFGGLEQQTTPSQLDNVEQTIENATTVFDQFGRPVEQTVPEVIDENTPPKYVAGSNQLFIVVGAFEQFSLNSPNSILLIKNGQKTWRLSAPSAVEARRMGINSDNFNVGEIVSVVVKIKRNSGNNFQTNDFDGDIIKLSKADGQSYLFDSKQLIESSFASIPSNTYEINQRSGQLQVSYDHFGLFSQIINFNRFKADIVWNNKRIANTQINFEIQTDSLQVRENSLRRLLLSEEGFDAANFPTMSFASQRVEITEWGNLIVTGLLSIKDVSRPMTLTIQLNKVIIHPLTQKQTAGISVSAMADRSDWQMSSYFPQVANKIIVQLDAELPIETEQYKPSVLLPVSPFSNSEATEDDATSLFNLNDN